MIKKRESIMVLHEYQFRDSMRIFAHQSGKRVGLKIKLVTQSIDRDGENQDTKIYFLYTITGRVIFQKKLAS
jgi:hypothetical protein